MNKNRSVRIALAGAAAMIAAATGAGAVAADAQDLPGDVDLGEPFDIAEFHEAVDSGELPQGWIQVSDTFTGWVGPNGLEPADIPEDLVDFDDGLDAWHEPEADEEVSRAQRRGDRQAAMPFEIQEPPMIDIHSLGEVVADGDLPGDPDLGEPFDIAEFHEAVKSGNLPEGWVQYEG